MAANSNYKVVNIEILTSPCRNCAVDICNRTTCEKLTAFQARCDQELPSYGVCDCTEDIPSPVKFNFTNDPFKESAAPAADAEEASDTAIKETKAAKPRGKARAKIEHERKSEQQPEPEQKPEPQPVVAVPEPLIPVDMTLDQMFPPARMAQLANTKFIQLSLF